MVKIPESVASAYCDFCTIPEKLQNTKAGMRQREEVRAYFQCTLCNSDLCNKHCFMVTIPRDYTAAEQTGELGEFWGHLCENRSRWGDGKVCPECSMQSLGKIGLLLLRNLRKRCAEERNF
jgi:hypothetical protein